MNYSMIWLLIGITLLIAEMLSGTFVLIFFSLGAFIAAIISLVAPQMLSVQIMADAIVSLGGALLLRKPLQRKLMSSNSVHADIGKELIIDEDIEPHQQTRISYQGTTWQASNVGTESIHKGDHVTIVGMDNLTLLLRKN